MTIPREVWQRRRAARPEICAYCLSRLAIFATTKAQEIRHSLEIAKACLKNAQHYMSQEANRHRRDVQLKVGDFVLLHSKDLKVQFKGSKKLMDQYFGPFQILGKSTQLLMSWRSPRVCACMMCSMCRSSSFTQGGKVML